MRTKNAKRLWPVPVTLGVMALAALAIASLWLISGDEAQAQAGGIGNVTIDVGATSAVVSAEDVNAALGITDPASGIITYTMVSDQDGFGGGDTDITDDNGNIEASGSSGSNGDVIAIDAGAITISTPPTQAMAEQADNTAKITVTATRPADTADPSTFAAIDAETTFNLTVVQNPFERNGGVVTNPTAWPATGDCFVQTAGAGTTLTSREITIDETSVEVLIDGGSCTSAGDSVDVLFRNARAPGAANDESFLVYVTGGGNNFPNVDGYPGKSGLKVEKLTVSSADNFGVIGEGKITVTRSMTDSNNQVYLYGYFDTDDTVATDDLGADLLMSVSQAFRTDADFVIRVQFVDGPALAFDASRNDMTFDQMLTASGDRDASTLRATIGSHLTEADNQDVNMDGLFDGSYTITAGSTDTVTVTATVKDANGNPLNAATASDSTVRFRVEYAPGSALLSGRVNHSDTKKIVKGMNMASIDVAGWQSNGAVKVTVSATYTGPGVTGGFDLGSVTLSRVGPLDSLVAESCMMLPMGTEDTNNDDGCMGGYNPQARYGSGDSFAINTMTTDSLGSNFTGETTSRIMPASAETWWDSLDCAGMNAAIPAGSTPAPGSDSTSPYCNAYDDLMADAEAVVDQVYMDMGFGDATMAFQVKANDGASATALTTSGVVLTGETRLVVKTDAKAGRYALAVSAASGGVTKYVIVPITIAGPPAIYILVDPAVNIALGGRQTFTVQAYDSVMSIPHLTATNNAVAVVVPDIAANLVRGLNSDGKLELDLASGRGAFTVYAPGGATNGSTARIFIGSGDAEITHTVTFGDSPPKPTVPGMPTSVMATADGHDTINVSWGAPASDGDSAITRYIIERRYTGDMMGHIPADGYKAAVGGASFAFTDHMQWWETLNCKGMLAAAGSSAAHTDTTNADVMMYCAHYDMTEPTNRAGTIVEGDATDMAIEALFDKRYVLIDDAATMMHPDTGLMAATEYTYRVSAVNSVGRSMWSAAVMATTGAAPTGPTGPMPDGTLAAVTLTVGDAAHTVNVVSAFTEADGDAVTYEAESDDTDVATVSVDGNIVSIMAEGAGRAIVTVTATDKDDSATQTIAVTVSPSAVASYGISADPGRIAAGMIGTVTVTALDANSKATSGGTVRISLSGNIGMVDVYDLSNGELELGNDGMGDFRIFAKADATSGSVTVTVIGDQDLDTASGMVYIGPNRNPVGEAIADQTVKAGESVMVESNFTDPDGDTSLTYAWSSDDEEIATVMADETDMSKAAITGVASGMVTITVTATDSEGGEGMQSFMVTVSVPPMASGMLEDVTLKVGDAPAMVDVSSAFTEADGDDVTYAAESDDTAVATVSVDGSEVFITAVGAGMATVSVTATDKDGTSEAVTIAVAVSVAPVASYTISDTGRIAAGMIGTVTVTALDASGNATAGGTVGISLSGNIDMVDVYDLSNGQLELGDDGMGSFRIFAKADATTGSVTVTVIGAPGLDTASQMVYIGPEPPMELGAPVMGTATSNAAGSATIMLTPGENATKHFVWAFQVGGTQGTYSGEAAGDATSVTMTGLESGASYWFIAVAGRGEGDDAEWVWAAGWTTATRIR